MGKIDQYAAVGLSPTVWGAEERADIEKNLDHLHGNLKAAIWLSGLELPVKLAVAPLVRRSRRAVHPVTPGSTAPGAALWG